MSSGPFGVGDRGQYVVFPAAVDQDVVARVPLDREAGPPQYRGAPKVARHISGHDAVQPKVPEGKANGAAYGFDHVAAALGILGQRVAENAVLGGSAVDLVHREVADHDRRSLLPKDEGAGAEAGLELGPPTDHLVEPVVAAEYPLGEGRRPGLQVVPVPLVEADYRMNVRVFREAEHEPVALDQRPQRQANFRWAGRLRDTTTPAGRPIAQRVQFGNEPRSTAGDRSQGRGGAARRPAEGVDGRGPGTDGQLP